MDCLKFTLAAALAFLLAACNDQSPPAVSSEPIQQPGQASMSEQPAGQPVGAQPVANAAPPATQYERPLGGHPIAANTSDHRVATRTPSTRAQIDVFYDGLNRHGSWVRHPDFSYVWLPRRGPGWRPYQEGRWIWTDDYGWFWESAEPFAWAVYHFGRWGYDPDFGWFWVAGDTWAPAWVTWRIGGGGIGWAPLAPDRRGFAFGPPRRFAPAVVEGWVFVEARKFADPDLAH
jgi:hypothetical protein